MDKELLTKLYWEKSLSLPKIAKRFGTYTSKIWQLMKLYDIPRRNMSESKRRFIQIIPSPSLSYAIGALIGDGYYWAKRHSVGIKVKDFDFINAFNRAISEVLSKKLYKIVKVKGRGQYQIATKMRAFSDWYIHLSEIERLEVASKYPADFIRGFADAEGSSRVKIKGNSKLIEITFSNTNIRYLATMRKLLAELDIQSSKIWTTHYRGHPYYAFAICSKKNVEKYYEKVGFSIQRKVLKVEE